MKRRSKRSQDWYDKLWSVEGLAEDIAELLLHHEQDCVSRLAAEYWLEVAGLSPSSFLQEFRERTSSA